MADYTTFSIEWASSIDLSKSRVIKVPSYIFLCGGPRSSKPNKYCSFRDIFYQYVDQITWKYKDKIIFAENIFSYIQHSGYNDLINFEKDIANLCAVTVIFSESPGSIAEFGSFSVMEETWKNLFVIMQRKDTEKESFIWRGPATYLIDRSKEQKDIIPIMTYNWGENKNKRKYFKKEDFSDTDLIDIKKTLEDYLSQLTNSFTFKENNTGHIMLLMLDIINMMRLATIEDIYIILNKMKITIDRNTIKRQLNLADKFSYGNYIYYASLSEEPWISMAYTVIAKTRDRDRWKALFFYNCKKSNENKFRAIKSYYKSKGLIGSDS